MAAAQAKQPRYSRWMAWSRPLAWAATVTLCLAITLELTRDQSFDSAVELPADFAQELDAPAELKELSRDGPAALADSIVAAKIAPSRSAAQQPVDQQPIAAQAADEPAVAEARRRQAEDQDALPPETRVIEEIVAVSEDEEQRPSQANAAGRAERSSLAMASATMEADAALAEYAATSIEECGGETRADPETWLECIQELEEAGDTEAAEQQRDALKEAFPDFKSP